MSRKTGFGLGHKASNPIEQLIGSYVMVGVPERYVGKLQSIDHSSEAVIVTDALMLFPGDMKVTSRGPLQFPTTTTLTPISGENYEAMRTYFNSLLELRGKNVLIADKLGGLVTEISSYWLQLNPSLISLPSVGWQKSGEVYHPYDSKEPIVKVDEKYLKKLVGYSKREVRKREYARRLETLEMRLKVLVLKKELQKIDDKKKIVVARS